MFHNYFFLKRLASDLHNRMVRMELLECFSQNKDELILGFAEAERELYIKATLESQICLLHISSDFKRARRNSVNLFPEIIGVPVREISVFRFERSFVIKFENGRALIFKMHGSRSNILLAESDQVTDVFRNNLPKDKEIIPSDLEKPDLSRQYFDDVEGNPKKFLPALGKEINAEYFRSEYANMTLEKKWHYLNSVLQRIEANPITILQEDDQLPSLSLLHETDQALWQSTDAIVSASEFYERFTKNFHLHHSKSRLLKELDERIRKTESYITKTGDKLQKVKTRRSYEEIANVIMANLHQFQQGRTEVGLDDFYTGQKLSIKLKPGVTPQKYAEDLYRKSKNQKIEIENLSQNIDQRNADLTKLIEQKREIQEIDDFKALRALNKSSVPQTRSNQPSQPFHLYRMESFEILVGKNAKSNDQLTTQIAHKNDTWLHARDVSGSHVIIRNSGGKSTPNNILEVAAEIAAWFSKRKSDSLCPVIYTEKKFVRKIKGTPAGQVRVDKESVIMVKPQNHPKLLTSD